MDSPPRRLWLVEPKTGHDPTRAAARAEARHERRIRALDVALAAAVLGFFAAGFAVAWLVAR